MKGRTVAALVVLAACTSPAPPEVTPVPVVVSSSPPATTARTGTRAATGREGSRGAGEARTGGENATAGRHVRDVGDTTIRVLLSTSPTPPAVTSPDGLLFTDREGSLVARGTQRESTWRVEHDGRRVRAVRPDGVPTVWIDPPLVVRALGDGLLAVGGKPYRGTLAFYGSDDGVEVVNVLKIDDYLLGVVPLEIGTTSMADSAAVEAQAVTARSYAYIHLGGDPFRPYDVTAGTLDQVYGGVAAETAVGSEAVEATRTLVLDYNGRVVNAPYHSTCGGTTAAASEIWRTADEPYLRSVSDRIPGTDRYYCDIAPRFRWTRTLDASSLDASVARYLKNYVSVPGGKPGAVQEVTIGSRTASGRVGTVTITTTRGNFVVRGNDVRFILRTPGGEILNSTYFSVESATAPDGALERIIVHGNGYGHGVGMCQWGAIGRARAGQDFRTILHTYYPGTTVGPAQ